MIKLGYAMITCHFYLIDLHNLDQVVLVALVALVALLVLVALIVLVALGRLIDIAY